MFSSWPLSALVAGVKIGSGKRLLSVRPAGKLDAADGAALLVFLPARTGQITAHHALDRHDFRLSAERRAAGQHGEIGARRQAHLFHVSCDEVVGSPNNLNQKAAICVSTRPLSGIAVGSTQSKALIRSVADQQQPIAEVVHVAHLAAAAPPDQVRTFLEQ